MNGTSDGTAADLDNYARYFKLAKTTNCKTI